MKAYQASAICVLAIAVSACGGNDMSMMSGYTQDLGRHVDALQAEQSTHSADITAAADLDSMARAEDDHWQRMVDHMSQMNTVMGSMMSCTDSRGACLDTAPFAGVMHDMRSDCDDHRKAMYSAVALDAARTEELRHQDAMRNRLATMRGQMNSMMGQGAGYMCSHGM